MTGFPDMSDALAGLGESLRLKVFTQTVENGIAKKSPVTDLEFEGVLTPLSASKVALKPEGERFWMWFSLTTVQKMKAGDTIVREDGTELKVLRVAPWGSFYEYDVAERA